MDIGFIGLGKMGGGMAANLIKAGHRLWGYDLSAEALARAVAAGATPCGSPREAAEGREIVFLSLTYPAVMEQVVVGPEGVLSAHPVPPLMVDTTTGYPTITRRVAAAALEKGCQMLDAPVTGRPEGAAAGTLSMMVGGPRAAFDRALPILSAVARDIFHVGDVGCGHTMKLVNNTISGATRAIIAEALVMGVLGGLRPSTIYDVISASTGNSRTFQATVPRLLSGDFEGAGPVDVLYKDLDLATRYGQELGVPMPVANIARELHQAARAAGLGPLDAAALAVPLERLMGVSLREE